MSFTWRIVRTTPPALALFLTSAAGAAVIDQETLDVRLVAAQISARVVTIGQGAGVDLPLSSCHETGRTTDYSNGAPIYDNVTLDCTAAFAAFAGAPALAPVVANAAFLPGTSTMVTPGIAATGRRVDVFTAIRQAALDASAGIGFYYGFHTSLTARTALKPFLAATNAAGEAVAVHRFAALFTGPAFDAILFKPFAAYDAGPDEFHNWENLAPRAGTPGWTGGPGSGEYVLRANQAETIRYTDVIRETSAIPVASAPPPLPGLTTESLAVDVLTVTHRDGHRDAEVALFPYVYGVDLPWDVASVTAEAGKRVWLRLADARAEGRTAHLVYRLSESGPESEASEYTGGNCYGFVRCFEVPLAATAAGPLLYRFELRSDAQGPVVLDDGGKAFAIAVAGAPAAHADLAEPGLAVSGSPRAGAALALSYAPKRALALAAAAGVVPEAFGLTAILKLADGRALRVPLGRISGQQNGSLGLEYRAKMAELLVQIPPVPGMATLTVEVKAYVHGSLVGTWLDDAGGAGFGLSFE